MRGDKRCNYIWLQKTKKRTSTILSIKHPMIKEDIERTLKNVYGFSEKTDIELDEFIKRGIVNCINPYVKQGKVFVLTKHGIRLTGKLAKESCNSLIWSYANPDIDLNLYGWIMSGGRRRQLLIQAVNEGVVTNAKYPGRAKAGKPVTSRSYSYKLLNMFAEKGLLKKIVSDGVNVYVPTEQCKKIVDCLTN